MVRWVIGLVLVGHGIGHTLGLLPALGLASGAGWTGDSWLLGGSGAVRMLGLVLWLMTTVGFVVLGAVYVGWLPLGWWRALAVAVPLLSLAALALFWQGFPSAGPRIGALAVDLAVLAAVLGRGWSPQ
jgi:hypothetical protein